MHLLFLRSFRTIYGYMLYVEKEVVIYGNSRK
jgi:hypothetical protein